MTAKNILKFSLYLLTAINLNIGHMYSGGKGVIRTLKVMNDSLHFIVFAFYFMHMILDTSVYSKLFSLCQILALPWLWIFIIVHFQPMSYLDTTSIWRYIGKVIDLLCCWKLLKTVNFNKFETPPPTIPSRNQ